jgi:hypothetical protein
LATVSEGIKILELIGNPEDLWNYMLTGQVHVFCIHFRDDIPVQEVQVVAEMVTNAREYLAREYLANKLRLPLSRVPISPAFFAFGRNIPEDIKSICDNSGIPVFDGFDKETISAELKKLTREVSGPIEVPIEGENANVPLSDQGDYQGDQEEADAEEYRQVLNALQPSYQNWRDLEY